MNVKQRLRSFIKAQSISIKAFEESINASNGYVNSISKSIGLDKLESIIEIYPNLNLEWLLTGEGEMLKKKDEDPPPEEKKPDENVPELQKQIIDLQNHRISQLEKEVEELKKELASANRIISTTKMDR